MTASTVLISILYVLVASVAVYLGDVFERLDELSAREAKLQEKVEEIDMIKSLMQVQMTQLTAHNDVLQDLTKLKDQLDATSLSTSAEPTDRDDIIAFCATSYRPETYAKGDVVRFQTLLTNVGDAYDARESIFKCPVSGFYSFTVSLAAVSGHQLRAMLVREWSSELAITAAVGEGDVVSTSSAVIRCQKDQRVYVMATDSGALFGDNSHDSSFSGMLVKATDMYDHLGE